MSRIVVAGYKKLRKEDAKKPLKFHVTRADVVGSVVADPQRCAGACAIKRITGAQKVYVRRSITVIVKDGKAIRYANPRPLRRAVEKFDVSAGFFPAGDYTLNPARPSQSMAAIKKYNAKLNRKAKRLGVSSRQVRISKHVAKHRKRPVVAFR